MTERTIFLTALDIDDPANRSAYLETACGDDGELRQRVEALLVADRAAGSFLSDMAPEQMGESPTVTQGGDPTPSMVPPGLDVTRSVEATDPDTVPSEALSFLKPTDRPGALGRLGHYDVLEIVGRGGMGLVLRAFDTRLHRIVAIKLMAPELAVSGAAKQRFLREARAAAAVRHENVIGIHAVEEQPFPYLVMEYIEGRTLQDKIHQQGAMPATEVLRIGYQIALGLAAAHKQGLVHRDIKPANILLENGVERVKISDFGLARAVDDASISQSGVIAGTPQYMSPEQADGKPVDHRSDLFSLGSVLYAACTGHPPFRADSTVAILKRVCEETPRAIRDGNPEIPEAVAALVTRLHAKAPEERLQTAKEVAELLGRYLAHVQQPGSVPMPPPVERTATEPKAAATSVAEPATAPSRRRWHRRAGIAVVAALILITLTIWGNLFSQRPWQFFYHELTLQLPDRNTVVEVWDTDDSQEHPNRWQTKSKWPFEARATVANRTEKRLRLPPGNYWVFATKDGKSVERRLIKIGWGGKQTLAIKANSSNPTAINAAHSGEGWIQLFNGKDLTGWKTHADLGGQWDVKDGILIGSLRRSILFSERGDYRNFHLRVEVKINLGGDSGIYLRAPLTLRKGDRPWLFGPDGCYEIDLHNDRTHAYPNGSVTEVSGDVQPTLLARAANESPIPPDEWYVLEVIAEDNRLITKINGQERANCRDPLSKHTAGHLGLQTWGPNTIVQFRKIEIKELQPAATLPDTPEQVLPALAGTWKGEYTQKIYGGKPAVKKFSALAVNDWIVGGKWLRQRVQMENEGFQSVTTFEPNSMTFRDWFFHSRGLIFGPSTGRWDPATRTMTWTNLPKAGVILLMTLRFLDADTFAGEILIRDKEGATVFEMASLMRRTTESVVIDEAASAGLLPPEMAVLNRLVGDWQTSGVIKDADHPDGRKATWESSVLRILGGRVIATQRTGYPGDDDSYSLSTFDTFAKAYGRWSFRADGSVMEYGGLWDEGNQTLKWHWAGKDGSQSSNTWPLRDPGRRDWHVLTKDALGQTTFEVQATSVRQSWVQLFNGKDLTGWKAHPDGQGEWHVKDKMLTCTGECSYLFTEADHFEDFHLRVEARINEGGDSGVFFRGSFAPLVRYPGITHPNVAGGYEAQVASMPHNRTGSLWVFTGVDKVPRLTRQTDVILPHDEWFTLEVRAEGNWIQVFVNGKKLADVANDAHRRGHVAVQHLGRNTKVQFRKIEIKELPATRPAATTIAGSWRSEDAELMLAHAPIRNDEPVRVTGTWKRGESTDDVKAATYDPATNTLRFEFAEGDDSETEAKMHLANDGAALIGLWTQDRKTTTVQTFWRKDQLPIDPRTRSIVGTWDSEWEVVIKHAPIQGSEPVPVEGTYSKAFRLKDGKFDPVTGVLTFTVVQGDETWFAKLLASPDGRQFSGAWYYTDGGHTRWIMKRRESDFAPLFNGQDLTGWKTHPRLPGEWRVENGVLTNTGPRSFLFTERDDYENFHLRVEAKINATGDSGVFFRSRFDPLVEFPAVSIVQPASFEVQIRGDEKAGRTGAIFLTTEGGSNPALTELAENLTRPDAWFTLEVIAQGPWLTVIIDGKQMPRLKNGTYRRGHIAVQHFDPKTSAQFRKIEIKELPAAKPNEPSGP